jgi:hypothetical protein
MTVITDRGPRYAASILGSAFLAYVASVSLDDMTARLDGDLDELRDENESALTSTLEWALGWVPVPTEEPALIADGKRPDGSPADRMRRFGWVDMDRGHSMANLVRQSSGGTLPPIPPGLDTAEQAIAWAAAEYYPVTLVPVARPDQPSRDLPIVSHAHTEAFVDAVRADGSIATIVDADDPVWTSASGFGFGPPGPTEPRVMGCVIASAEQRVRMFSESSPEAFIDACVAGLNTVRHLCAGRDTQVSALIGFSHVSFPVGAGGMVGPRGGNLRPARDSDLRIPGTSPARIVLETTQPLRMAISRMPPTDQAFFRGAAQADVDTDVVSLAALLATRGRDAKALARQTWIKVFDPISPFTGSLKPQHPGLLDVTLDDDEVSTFGRWIRRIEANYHPNIRVPVKRCISGCAERQTPEDAIVDLVIALESLFGDVGGELRLRISAAVAWLLGNDAEERAAIQRDAKRAYDLRSKIVHGAEIAGDHVQEGQGLIERLALDVLERLLTERTDLIPDRERSLKLLIGQ